MARNSGAYKFEKRRKELEKKKKKEEKKLARQSRKDDDGVIADVDEGAAVDVEAAIESDEEPVEVVE